MGRFSTSRHPRSTLPAGWRRQRLPMGFPLTHDDAGTAVPGLYFCGVHFLRKRQSSTLFGVGEDAGVVARSIARNRRGSG